jgi:hypothetical protein
MGTRRAIVILCGLALLLGAQAEAGKRKPRAYQVKARPSGGDALWVDGAPVWPKGSARPGAEVVGPFAWSARGNALAWIARDHGHTLLIVSLLDAPGEDGRPLAMEWPLPDAALPARAITWLGPARVAVGPAELDPKIVATWKVR